MGDLPAGTVTFLFTDVERSTELVQRLGDAAYGTLIDTYRALLRSVFAGYGGREIDTQGDAFFVAFAVARDAVYAAVAIQEAVATHPWPPQTLVEVRIGLHTGTPVVSGGAYVGVDVHRAARICAAGHGGQVLLSQATCALVADALSSGVQVQDLGEHRLRDLRRPERIFQVLHPHLPPDLPPLRSLSILPHNLPVQLTSFVGRAREMAEVKRLLAATRLLTLTGVGGSGKTRLALHVAAEVLDAYPDGIWVVELAGLTDATLVPPAIAAELHAREEPGRSLLATLADFLHEKHLLLILDNCEHVVAACAEIADALLRSAPHLQILATTRERLGVPGEVGYVVPPLTLPQTAQVEAITDMLQTESVRLFLERAAAVHPGFALTAANAADTARIVQTLDGIPLAIELAAARAQVLSVSQIAARLYDRFHLLTSGIRTAAPRQQTLQATMDWSYDLLAEAERTMLRRVSVFSGGFTLEAIEAICAGGDIHPRDALDLLTRLVDKSLVMVDERNGARRFRLLDTIREYAGEKLAASGEAAGVRSRHSTWYRQLVEQAEPHMEVLDRHWMDQLEVEHDNIRTALETAVTPAGGEAALSFVGALQRFWHVRGYWTEGRHWLETALAATPRAARAQRARTLGRLATLIQLQGDYARARTLAEEALALYRTDGNTQGMAVTLNILGNIAYHQGDYRAARDLHTTSLARGREVGDKHSIASALLNLAIVADHLGQYQQAVTWCRESLALFREIGDPRGLAFAVSLLGTLASDQGDFGAAHPLLEESLQLQRQSGDKRGVANTLLSLGSVTRNQGDLEAAQRLLAEGLAIRRELGDKRGIAASLHALAHVAVQRGAGTTARTLFAESLAIRRSLGDKVGAAESLEGLAQVAIPTTRAVRFLAAADGLRKALGSSRQLADQQGFDRRIASLRAGMNEKTFRVAWSAGAALTLEQAVDDALAPGEWPETP